MVRSVRTVLPKALQRQLQSATAVRCVSVPMMAVAAARQRRKALSDPPHGKKSAQTRASPLILQHNFVATSDFLRFTTSNFIREPAVATSSLSN
jgi:hypothetical protein